MRATLAQARALRTVGQHSQACDLLLKHRPHAPANAVFEYELACLQDFLGLTHDAIRSYDKALGAGLKGARLRGAFLGLGSSLRAIGDYDRAIAILDEGTKKFPRAHELEIFKVMALYNVGESKAAVQICLRRLALTSTDKDIQAFKRPILAYARDLDRKWLK